MDIAWRSLQWLHQTQGAASSGGTVDWPRNAMSAIIRAVSEDRSKTTPSKQSLRETQPPVKKPSLKELLLAMPDVGEDSDFDRTPDYGRAVEL
ncbi:MAG TPA: hypothetical protein VGE98_14265 [Thermoanaerobaculia bacterium]